MADKLKKSARRRSKRNGEPHVRVEDVAAAAGVSSATVSRVLNRTGRVGSAMRQRIEQLVAELGYVPNGAARALASHRTRAVGVVIPTLENANFSIMAESARRYLNSAGYHMLVASSSYEPAQEWGQIQSLVAHGVDGLILVGARRAPEVVDYLKSKRVQFVVTWTLADADTPCVGFDNAAAARRLASHLLDLGHTQIGVIAGLTKNNDRAAARIEGIRTALGERGLAFPHELLIERPYKIADGQFALRTLLAVKPRPTAVICGNDQLAFGALIECGRRKISVPRELSVVGFDDLEFASQIVPSLTTIRVPAEEIGTRAAEMLLSRLSETMSPQTVEIEVSLVVRDSSAALQREHPSESGVAE